MKVFLSYRRADLGGKAPEIVARLYDELAVRWGKDNIFLDMDKFPRESCSPTTSPSRWRVPT
jgi:hypothetical protein